MEQESVVCVYNIPYLLSNQYVKLNGRKTRIRTLKTERKRRKKGQVPPLSSNSEMIYFEYSQPGRM